MTAYAHFGLKLAPFEGKPDPRFFCALPAHAEVLATLQFAVHAGKACTLVLGDSGSGKTLLGCMLAKSLGPHVGLLWVHGIGQAGGDTDVTICPAGTLSRPETFGHRAISESTLNAWIRAQLPTPRPTVVVVDNADGLAAPSWESILTLVTREMRFHKPLSVVLFGLPRLIESLADPRLVRLRRRLFRTCHLPRLSRANTEEYVRERLTVAGAPNPDVFLPPAVDLIHRFSGGNPALVNQLCDNAMVEAYAGDRTRIDAADIRATVQVITGGPLRKRYLPEMIPASPPDPIEPDVPDVPDEPATVAAELAAELALSTQALRPAVEEPIALEDTQFPAMPADSPPEAELPTAHEAQNATAAGDVEAPIVTAAAETEDLLGPQVTYVPIDERLRGLESRLTNALARLRVARARPRPLKEVMLTRDVPANIHTSDDSANAAEHEDLVVAADEPPAE